MKGGKWNKKAFNTLIYPFLKAKCLEWDKCLNRISSTRLFSQRIKRSNMNWLSQFPHRSSCSKKHRNCHLLNKTKSQRNSQASSQDEKSNLISRLSSPLCQGRVMRRERVKDGRVMKNWKKLAAGLKNKPWAVPGRRERNLGGYNLCLFMQTTCQQIKLGRKNELAEKLFVHPWLWKYRLLICCSRVLSVVIWNLQNLNRPISLRPTSWVSRERWNNPGVEI